MTCQMTSLHDDGKLALYCSYCKDVTVDGILRRCTNCPDQFNLKARLEYCQLTHDVDDTSTSASITRESTQSPSASDDKSSDKGSNGSDSEYTPSTTSEAEADMDEDEDVAREVVPMSSGATRPIKQEQPDAVMSITAYDEDTVNDDIARPPEVKSSAVPLMVKSEAALRSEGTDVDDSASSKEVDDDEDDVAPLIYQESHPRKRDAAVAEQEEQRPSAPKKRRKASSTRKASAAPVRADRVSKKNEGGGAPFKGKRKSLKDEEKLQRKSPKSSTEKNALLMGVQM